MARTGIMALAFVAGVAQAQEFSSEPQQIVVQGGSAVLGQRLVFPLTVDAGFVEDLGVTATITASSNLFVKMEGSSDLTWPDPSGQGNVRQTIEPLPNGSEMAMTSEVTVDVDFGFRVDIFGIQGAYSFNLLSRSIVFRPRIEDFEPFLLPSQDVRQLRVDADPLGGIFELIFPIDLVSLFSPDILGISLVVEFRATPLTYSLVRGHALDTLHEGDRYRFGDPTFPVSMTLYENNGFMPLETEYTVDTDTVIGYRLTGDGSIILNILGFEFPFTIRFLDVTLNLFTGSERATYTSGPYDHPLPVITTPITTIDFGTIEVGDAEVFTFPVNNEGELPLDALMVLEALPNAPEMPFALSPDRIQAAAGQQDVTVLTFRPEEAGDFIAKMKIFSSDPLSPVREVAVTGRAVEPEDIGGGEDNPDNITDGGRDTLYTGCACDTRPTGSGGLALAGLVGLAALRRRRG